MGIFNNLVNKDKFPNECDDGVIKIVGSKIICDGNHGIQSCEVNIDDIQYAYVIVNVNKQSFLFLFDYHQNLIPTIYSGFKKVYAELTERFKFNDTVFFENVNRNVELKKEIWRRKYEPTYRIIEDGFCNYDSGFEIQSPERQFISWETTYEAIQKSGNVVFEKSPYGQKISKFKYPIRIGKIIVSDFLFYIDNSRTDVPVLHFYSQCFDQSGSDKSYNDIKNVLLNDIEMYENGFNYERTDQKNLNFNLNGMNLSICYTYDSDWQFNCGYTSLSIENRREYSTMLIDTKYENELVIGDFLILEGNIETPEDYKRNKKVKRRQGKITEKFQAKAVIWIDDVNNKIGFSSGNFSQVYEEQEIKSFCIQNILPAKGSGGGYLEIVLENQDSHYTIFTEHCHFFDKYADGIKKITSKELTFGQEYYDC